MTYSEQLEDVFPAPKRGDREVEEAAFAMQEELKEAEAAVEEFYRRQARRAGLAEMLPADRPMTEKELDTLSELMGDGIGARAKRRREIEEMTLVEMEAELGEVQAEIKRRRRAGMGWLPLTLVLLLCFTGHPAEGSPNTTTPSGATLWRPTCC